MEQQLCVCDMRVGDTFEGFYILRSAASKISSNGKPFLSAVLGDATGDVDAKVWDYHGSIGPADEGAVLRIRGTVTEFRGALQVNVDKIRLAESGDNYDPAALVPTAPIDPEAAYRELMDFVKSIEDRDYRDVALDIFDRHGGALKTIPAAKSVHHSFLSGLLMHTLNMVRQADFLARLYGDTVDRSLLIAGTCLHDIGKEREFMFTELGLVTEYSVSGELLGHLVMGAGEVAETAKRLDIPEEKAVLLEHMLLSHHGEPEFGAAVRPMCAEAELLSYIDLIDSRMEIYRENLASLEPGQFSQRIFALDKKIYKH